MFILYVLLLVSLVVLLSLVVVITHILLCRVSEYICITIIILLSSSSSSSGGLGVRRRQLPALVEVELPLQLRCGPAAVAGDQHEVLSGVNINQ